MKHISIALDGPSGAGKSTLAKAIAAKLSILYVDTGAMYRTIALACLRQGIDVGNTDAICAYLPQIRLKLSYVEGSQRIFLGEEDVSGLIRTPEVSMGASAVSAIPAVRTFLLDLQRSMAKTQSVIMDGRDIGTVILPHADVKIFLDAKPEARAKRRLLELTVKGIETTLDAVLADMKKRDEDDRTRAVAPAVPAHDAVFLDNSDLTFAQTIDAAIAIIEEKTK